MINVIKKFRSLFIILGIAITFVFPKVSYAYPVFAQQAYANPREATGRIVCANCHRKFDSGYDSTLLETYRILKRKNI